MAVIGTLRKRAGIVIIFIGLSMVLFLLTDMIQSSGNIFGRDTVVGVVKGEEIEYKDFVNKIKKLEKNETINHTNHYE